MKNVFISFAIGLLKLLAYLPEVFLRGLGLFSAWLLYRVIGYRRQIVSLNIKHAFASLSDKVRRQLVKDYYRHLGTLLYEMVLGVRLSAKQLVIRCTMHQSLTDLFQQFYHANQDFIVLMGHTGNWEWSGLATSSQVQHRVVALYRPIKNKQFDRFMFRYRTRTGMHLLPMHTVTRAMIKKAEKPTCYTFIADQSPVPEYAAWFPFFNQETAFFQGYELLARRYQLPVVYVSQKKREKGGYDLYGELICMKPHQEEPMYVVKTFINLLERDIHQQPAQWLWSHRRWKHKRR